MKLTKDTKILDAGFDTRARKIVMAYIGDFKSLHYNDYAPVKDKTLEDLAAATEEEILNMPMCGVTTLGRIKAKLAEAGLTLKHAPCRLCGK